MTAPATTAVDTRDVHHPYAWRAQAACRTEDPELFFPVSRGAAGRREAESAKAICRRCPVRQACLDWAVRTGQPWGIYGGHTEDERRALRRAEADR